MPKFQDGSFKFHSQSPDCYMVTIDLKDAHYDVPIHQDHQKYLRVAVQMGPRVVHFQYRALPFGIAIAPRVFTKIVAEMAAHVREESGVFVLSGAIPDQTIPWHHYKFKRTTILASTAKK